MGNKQRNKRVAKKRSYRQKYESMMEVVSKKKRMEQNQEQNEEPNYQSGMDLHTLINASDLLYQESKIGESINEDETIHSCNESPNLEIMSTSNESQIMENSTILQKIADFDTAAPISYEISYEEEVDETPIRKEIAEDDEQEKTQEQNKSPFIPILIPKTEKPDDEITEHNNDQEPFAQPADQQEDKLSTRDTLQKRKIDNIQTCLTKKLKTVIDKADQNDCGNKVYSHFFTHTTNDNSGTDPKIATSEKENNNSIATAVIASNPANKNAGSSQPRFDGLHQSEKEKINTIIINCLASLSESMRLVIQAFRSQRQNIISKEDFLKIKRDNFTINKNTLKFILLPEANNKAFITTFLNDTLQRARKKSGPYYIPTCEDYGNLLHEMLIWIQKCEHEVNSNKNERSDPVRQQQLNGANAAANKICIFSSGPPETALSINIDPNVIKSLEIGTQNNTATSQHVKQSTVNDLQTLVNSMTPQSNAASDCILSCQENNVQTIRPPVIQTTASFGQNPPTNFMQQKNLSFNNKACSMSNVYYSTAPQKTATPVLSMYLQDTEQQRAPPSYEISRCYPSQLNQAQLAALSYDQSRRLQSHTPMPQKQHTPMPQKQYTPMPQRQHTPMPQKQHAPMSQQYTPIPLQQQHTPMPQQPHPPSPYVLSQLSQQSSTFEQAYIQTHLLSQNGQTKLNQSHLQNQQHPQTSQPPVRLPQPTPPLSHQQLSDRWPSLDELLAVETRPPPAYPTNIDHSVTSGQWQLRSQASQPQPSPASGTEWNKKTNANYQGQVPLQAQKGSPRSASTDSGFISPLNFNVSTEQTIPTEVQEAENSMPMIVHVTSLSEKAAFVQMGKCVVCSNNTKQMCMACMKVYYCNFQCQSHDWVAHSQTCSQQYPNYRS